MQTSSYALPSANESATRYGSWPPGHGPPRASAPMASPGDPGPLGLNTSIPGGLRHTQVISRTSADVAVGDLGGTPIPENTRILHKASIPGPPKAQTSAPVTVSDTSSLRSVSSKGPVTVVSVTTPISINSSPRPSAPGSLGDTEEYTEYMGQIAAVQNAWEIQPQDIPIPSSSGGSFLVRDLEDIMSSEEPETPSAPPEAEQSVGHTSPMPTTRDLKRAGSSPKGPEIPQAKRRDTEHYAAREDTVNTGDQGLRAAPREGEDTAQGSGIPPPTITHTTPTPPRQAPVQDTTPPHQGHVPVPNTNHLQPSQVPVPDPPPQYAFHRDPRMNNPVYRPPPRPSYLQGNFRPILPPFTGCEICGKCHRGEPQPFEFRNCNYCGQRPAYHHGRCCPCNPENVPQIFDPPRGSSARMDAARLELARLQAGLFDTVQPYTYSRAERENTRDNSGGSAGQYESQYIHEQRDTSAPQTTTPWLDSRPDQAAAADANACPQTTSGLLTDAYWLDPAADTTAAAAAAATVGSEDPSADTVVSAPTLTNTNNTGGRSEPIPLTNTGHMSMDLVQSDQGRQFSAHEVVSLFEGITSVEQYPDLAASVREHRDRIVDAREAGLPIPQFEDFPEDPEGVPEAMLVDDSELRDSLASWNLFPGDPGPQDEGGLPAIQMFPIDANQGHIPVVAGIPIQDDTSAPLVMAEQEPPYIEYSPVDPDTAIPIQVDEILDEILPLPFLQQPQPQPIQFPPPSRSTTSDESTQDMLVEANREIARLRYQLRQQGQDPAGARYIAQLQTELNNLHEARRIAETTIHGIHNQLQVERQQRAQIDQQVRRYVQQQNDKDEEWRRVTAQNTANMRYTSQRLDAAIRQQDSDLQLQNELRTQIGALEQQLEEARTTAQNNANEAYTSARDAHEATQELVNLRRSGQEAIDAAKTEVERLRNELARTTQAETELARADVDLLRAANHTCEENIRILRIACQDGQRVIDDLRQVVKTEREETEKLRQQIEEQAKTISEYENTKPREDKLRQQQHDTDTSGAKHRNTDNHTSPSNGDIPMPNKTFTTHPATDTNVQMPTGILYSSTTTQQETYCHRDSCAQQQDAVIQQQQQIPQPQQQPPTQIQQPPPYAQYNINTQGGQQYIPQSPAGQHDPRSHIHGSARFIVHGIHHPQNQPLSYPPQVYAPTVQINGFSPTQMQHTQAQASPTTDMNTPARQLFPPSNNPAYHDTPWNQQRPNPTPGAPGGGGGGHDGGGGGWPAGGPQAPNGGQQPPPRGPGGPPGGPQGPYGGPGGPPGGGGGGPPDGGNPGYDQWQGTWYPIREKEAYYIKIPDLPETANYRRWQLLLRSNILSASGKGDECLAWIRAPEDPNVTIGDLANSGQGYETLDLKLAKALTDLIIGERKNAARIAVTVRQEIEAAHARNVPMRGRQILKMIYGQYELDETQWGLYTLTQIQNCTYNTRRPLKDFLHAWTQLFLDVPHAFIPAKPTLLTYLMENLNRDRRLQQDFRSYMLYCQQSNGPNITRDYDALLAWLWTIVDEYDRQKTFNRMKEDKSRGWTNTDRDRYNRNGNDNRQTPRRSSRTSYRNYSSSGERTRRRDNHRRNDRRPYSGSSQRRPPPRARAAAANESDVRDPHNTDDTNTDLQDSNTDGHANAARSDGTPVTAIPPKRKNSANSYKNQKNAQRRSASPSRNTSPRRPPSPSQQKPRTAQSGSQSRSSYTRQDTRQKSSSQERSRRQTRDSSLTNRQKDECKNRGLCIAYQTNACKNGNNCKFSHAKLGGSRAGTPAPAWRTSASRSGSRNRSYDRKSNRSKDRYQRSPARQYRGNGSGRSSSPRGSRQRDFR